MQDKTVSEKALYAKKQMDNLLQSIKETADGFVTSPEALAEFFAFGSYFKNYSPNNNMLIHKQNPSATFVASYTDWQKKGAQVQKGQKSIKILAPVKLIYLKTERGSVLISKATPKERQDYAAGRITATSIIKFKIENVFDIGQTDYPKEKYPKLYYMGHSSVLHEDICKGLIDYSERELKCKVNISSIPSISLRGYYVSGISPHIELNDKLESTQRLSTLSHELGHAMLHSSLSTKSKAQNEFEADAISIMLSGNYNLDIEDLRKDHLKTCFDAYKKELMDRDGNVNENALQKAFKSVFEIYNEHIEKIEECVNRKR